MSLDEYTYRTDAADGPAMGHYLTHDDPAEGLIARDGRDRDWYYMPTDPGSAYWVIVSQGSKFAFDPAIGVYFNLYDAWGNYLFTSLSLDADSDSAYFTATGWGHYVEVLTLDWNWRDPGAYTLVSGNYTTPDDHYLPIAIASGTTYTASLDYTADQETFQGALTAGVRYFVALWSDSVADLVLDIEEPTGGSAGFFHAGPPGLGRYFTPTESGTHGFQVSSDSFYGLGTYQFFLQWTYTRKPLEIGTSEADAFTASGAVEFWGWAGDDRAAGSRYADVLVGGDGRDTLQGAGGADRLLGEAGNDLLAGGGGHDALDGGEGDDTLAGGNGLDTLTGGAGADAFRLTGPAAGADRIEGFDGALDRIEVSSSGFGLGLPRGALPAERFAANATGAASGGVAQFCYDTDAGELWFDANGAAAGGRTPVALLAGAPALSAADLAVIG
jgi:hypothetical protein